MTSIKNLVKTVLAVFLISFSFTIYANDFVKIAQGELKGQTKEEVTSFLGIPFAKPPVGEL